MRILIFGDVHFSTYSSILRARGVKYSARLENLIASLNWLEQLSKDKQCDEIVCLGDFFNRPELEAEEISALKEVNWNEDIPSHFIVGNHESGIHTLVFNSTNALNKPSFTIEYKPRKYDRDEFADIYFLPYIIEDDRKPLKEYLTDYNPNKKHIIFSHNDLKGIQYGMVESKEGFTIPEIEECCDLFINGHLHNGCFINEKETILNLGILTGQNFVENAWLYSHNICILDTETLKMEFIENPHAFNFYKVDINKEEDLEQLEKVKQNSVISIKCNENYVDTLRKYIDNNPKIVESKVIIQRDLTELDDGQTIELNSNDYLQQFYDFALERLGKTEIVLHELGEVCK